MGAHLIRSSEFVRRRLQDLEKSLATLPPADQPKWNLTEQILAGKETSRIAEAALSQPLCTAIQVVMVDLLRTAGINFTTVVGHSSGEIGAAVCISLKLALIVIPRRSQISRRFLMQ
jgi:hybrid polyketide synthase/nonribosomal peptide synthetase ACE1